MPTGGAIALRRAGGSPGTSQAARSEGQAREAEGRVRCWHVTGRGGGVGESQPSSNTRETGTEAGGWSGGPRWLGTGQGGMVGKWGGVGAGVGNWTGRRIQGWGRVSGDRLVWDLVLQICLGDNRCSKQHPGTAMQAEEQRGRRRLKFGHAGHSPTHVRAGTRRGRVRVIVSGTGHREPRRPSSRPARISSRRSDCSSRPPQDRDHAATSGEVYVTPSRFRLPRLRTLSGRELVPRASSRARVR